MSIVSSREERQEATKRATEETSEQLRADLEYWTVAKLDHHKSWLELTEQRGRIAELYSEADAWVDLIAEELHRRRNEALT